MPESMAWQWFGNDSAAIAGDVGIHPIFINVAVKNLTPFATTWESDPVDETMECRQMHNDNHIVPLAFNPAVKDKYAVLIVHMDHTKSLPPQAGKLPAQLDQFAYESEVIEHLLITLIQAGPM